MRALLLVNQNNKCKTFKSSFFIIIINSFPLLDLLPAFSVSYLPQTLLLFSLTLARPCRPAFKPNHIKIAPQNQTPASLADSSQTFRVAVQLSSEQSQQSFQIYLPNVQDKRAAAAKIAELELECLRKESDARIASAAAASVAATAAPRKPLGKDNDVIGEILLEVQTLTIRFAGLPQEEIVKIFYNKSRPTKLYHLRRIRGLPYETYRNQDSIGI